MSRIPCPTCNGPRRGDQNLCGGCQAELGRALDAVPDLVRDLDITLSRQTSRTVAGKTSTVPLPFDARASEAAWVLRSALAGWVRVLQETQPEPRPDDRPAAMAAWLSARLQRLVRHPAAPEAHGEICDAVRAAQRAVDRRPERQFAGRCPECGTALYAKPGATVVQCREDGCEADPIEVQAQRDAMLDQMQDHLVTATQAADILTRLAAPLKAELVRQWGARGQIAAHGRDTAGHPLYRVSDVREELVKKLQREQRAKAKREAKEREMMSA